MPVSRKKWTELLFIFLAALILLPAVHARGAGNPAGEEALKIQHYGPTGAVKGQVQVQVIFNRPLIPLTTLDDARREEILSSFTISPQTEGRFRFLGTSGVVFEPEHSLPFATRYRVNVSAGLTDIDGNRLDEGLSWEFTTPPISISVRPSGADHVTLRQDVTITSNLALDVESLRQRCLLATTSTGTRIPFQFLESDQNPTDKQELGFQRGRRVYIMRPLEDYPKYASIKVTVESGVMPRRGNMPTDRAVTATFRTYGPFNYINTGFCNGCGGKLVTVPYLQFTNKPDWEQFRKVVSIDPAPEKFPFSEWSCVSYGHNINDYLLEPHTTYTLVLPGGLKDVYGQELTNPQTVTFTTGGLTPKLWGPRGYQVITPHLPTMLGIKTVNIPTLESRVAGLSSENIATKEISEAVKRWRGGATVILNALDVPSERTMIQPGEEGVGKTFLDLAPHLNGGQYGAVAYFYQSPYQQCYKRPLSLNGVVLRTGLGIYTQFLPTGGLIKVNSLSDGSPAAGVRVALYRKDSLPSIKELGEPGEEGAESRRAEPCLTGITDDMGMLEIDAGEAKACLKRNIENKILNDLLPPESDPDDILFDRERTFAEPPLLLITAQKGEDWTFLHTTQYGTPSIWSFGVYTDWEGQRPISRGTIFSDRKIYRPGELVRMKGISRFLLYGRLLSGRGSEYKLKIVDPRGKEKPLGEARVGEFGTFHFEIPTKPGMPLGYYSVVAESPHPNLKFYGNFRLEEFRSPEFKASMEADRKVAHVGEEANLNWNGNYYFGAPMADAPSSLIITRSRTNYRPAGWEGFSFGFPGYLEDRKVSVAGMVLKEPLNLDADGKGSRAVKLEEDLPYPMSYRVDVEIEDVSKQTVSANTSFTVLPDRRLIGMKLSKWIVTKDDTLSADIIVTDPDGNPLPGERLQVSLVKREWHSIRRETAEGRFTTEHSIVLTPVETHEISSGKDAVTVSLTPEKAGSYIVLAEIPDGEKVGRPRAALSVWAAGSEYVPWEGAGQDRIEIVMDKKEYEPGEEALAFIKSPFKRAEALITVCREKIFLQEIINIEGSGFTYRFTVTEDMLPNAYFGAVLINRGEPLVEVEEQKGYHMEKIGFAPFKVSIEGRRLAVKISPDRGKLRPGEVLSVDVEVKDSEGKGRRSELTVMVVDEAVLALTGYRPPDLVNIVYRQRGLSARINDNRPFIVAQSELLQKGAGYGGGLERAEPAVRREFLRLAYYDPSLITGEDGRARFTFKAPDNLTTWRLMVVAVGEEDRFGDSDEKVIVTQPFLLRAVLPRFVRVGDAFYGGVAVSNLTKSPGSVKVTAELTGGGSTLDPGPEENLSRTIDLINPGKSDSALFAFRAREPGEALLKFTAYFTGEDGGEALKEADALEVPLDVDPLEATETVVAVGETDGKSSESIQVGDGIRTDFGGLRVTLSSTALTNMGEGARYLVKYPYGCLEQTVSRLLALIELKFLSDRYGFSLEAVKPVDKVINANLDKVYRLQNSDGGFTFWPGGGLSACYMSHYVAHLFKRCRELGYEVPREVIDDFIRYMENALRNPCTSFTTWQGLAEYRITVLQGLADLGVANQTFFEEYFNRRNDLSFGARIALAGLLYDVPDWRDEAGIMFREVENGLFITARAAHFEDRRDLPASWRFMHSPVITTSAGLKLFLKMEPDNGFVSKMARYILDARKNGRWRTTYENARAIDAVVEVALIREATPPDFLAEVRLAGKKVLEELFAGYKAPPRETAIPAGELPKGLSKIDISKDGDGLLYWTLEYSYRLAGSQPSRSEGFSVTRKLIDPESGDVLATFGNDPPPPVTVEPGKTLQVELEFLVSQSSYHLIVDDAMPAGLEPIDTSLKTTSTRYQGVSGGRSGGDYFWNPFRHREIHDDRVVLIAPEIQPGVYRYRYMVRAMTPGTFIWPGTQVLLMYEPEQFARGSEGTCAVQ